MATYTFVVEVLDLLAEHEIFQQSRTSLTSAQTLLILHGTANIAREVGAGRVVGEFELREEVIVVRRFIDVARGMFDRWVTCRHSGASSHPTAHVWAIGC